MNESTQRGTNAKSAQVERGCASGSETGEHWTLVVGRSCRAGDIGHRHTSRRSIIKRLHSIEGESVTIAWKSKQKMKVI
jgi:hypothetical protein